MCGRCATPCNTERSRPVESAVQSELDGLTADRPGLVQAAYALARILDSQKALSSQPPAAKVLIALLDRLHEAAAPRPSWAARVGAATNREGRRLSADGGPVCRSSKRVWGR